MHVCALGSDAPPRVSRCRIAAASPCRVRLRALRLLLPNRYLRALDSAAQAVSLARAHLESKAASTPPSKPKAPTQSQPHQPQPVRLAVEAAEELLEAAGRDFFEV